MKVPLVSGIIPVFNEEKYLPFCLSSLKTQTYRNFEIIVIDDGSTDKSLEIAKKFEVRLFRQNHQGPGIARNLGARRARGEILVFVDADMKFDENYLNFLVEPIIKGKTIGTFHGQEFVANSNNIWSKCWGLNSDFLPGQRLPKNMVKKTGVFRAILKRNFLSSGGFDSTKGYMDDGTIFEKVGAKALRAPKAKCYHFNPETLKEVLFSARWIGKSGFFKKNLVNFFRYSPLNSLRIGFRNVIFRNAPLRFIIFKLVFDTGMFLGIFFGKAGEPK